MTERQAYSLVINARHHLVAQRHAGVFGDDLFNGNDAYREAWRILFAAEIACLDPKCDSHYKKILRLQ